jgi:hypothetical protein
MGTIEALDLLPVGDNRHRMTFALKFSQELPSLDEHGYKLILFIMYEAPDCVA